MHSQSQIMEQTRGQILLFNLNRLQGFGNIWRKKIYQKDTCLKTTILQGGVEKSSHRTFFMDSSEGFCDLSKGWLLTWLTCMTPNVLFLTLKFEFIGGDWDCLRFSEVPIPRWNSGTQWVGSCESCVEALL